jgi:hypothetical protein
MWSTRQRCVALTSVRALLFHLKIGRRVKPPSLDAVMHERRLVGRHKRQSTRNAVTELRGLLDIQTILIG